LTVSLSGVMLHFNDQVFPYTEVDLRLCFSHGGRQHGCGIGVVRSRRFLGGVGFLTTLGVGVGFFVRLRLRVSSWIIFYITLLN